ncbi:LysR family transcriptional regulator [Tissierella sp.]|uniref:LysR family transcriptional regulator n=1 Tax=Tissierella sp. TaxID=41274 RepID=UPI0028B1E50B|nr:LysR family transcriptional regulator [Tissierella sp.]
MEIRQLEYMLTIVKSDFNLTKSSELLLVSQPALSKMITTFENQVGIDLFERRKGRLVGLTPAGEILIKYANTIISTHNEMNKAIKQISKNIVGNVKFGVPSMILEVLFTDIITKFIIENPNILFEIIENSATQLNKKFLNSEVDILISIADNHISSNNVQKKVIASEAFVAIMDIKNPLTEIEYLDWEDLNSVKLSLPSDKYFTHSLVKKKLENKNVKSNIVISAASHEFLIKSTNNSDLITILPKIFYDSLAVSNDFLVYRNFKEPIYWDVEMSTKKYHLDNMDAVGFVYDLILNYF